ncbi:hypothetical protein FB451DRAFT_489586 [Mycena latifolia]|nr:hypothetical protein FB451DRAFT_489586 [Mycena latifolia]
MMYVLSRGTSRERNSVYAAWPVWEDLYHRRGPCGMHLLRTVTAYSWYAAAVLPECVFSSAVLTSRTAFQCVMSGVSCGHLRLHLVHYVAYFPWRFADRFPMCHVRGLLWPSASSPRALRRVFSLATLKRQSYHTSRREYQRTAPDVIPCRQLSDSLNLAYFPPYAPTTVPEFHSSCALDGGPFILPSRTTGSTLHSRNPRQCYSNRR